MTIDELNYLHEKMCEEARKLMLKKNHDYTAGSDDPFANFRMSEFVGIDARLSILVRMLDKIKRLETQIQKGKLKVSNETMKDSIIDIINYTVLLYGMETDIASPFQ